MKNLIVFCCLLLLIVPCKSFSASIFDVEDDISNAIKSGNSKEVAKYFASTVSMSLPGTDDSYSKVQAEAALQSFFSAHEPVSIKPLHKLSSNPNHKYAVVLLHTGSGDFRVSFSLRNGSSGFELNEITIEPLKD